jgi:ABC-type phosphate transport system substrate-binding protein
MYQFRTSCLAVCAAGLLLASQHALADVVVIVGAKSAVAKMSGDEVSQVFLGKSSSMKPVDNGEKAVRSAFYNKVAGKDEAQIKAIWSKLVFTGKAAPPAELATSAAVVKAVANGTNLIGYVDSAAVDASVKVVLEVK